VIGAAWAAIVQAAKAAAMSVRQKRGMVRRSRIVADGREAKHRSAVCTLSSNNHAAWIFLRDINALRDGRPSSARAL